ncbi:hypothetical protein KUTeg_022571 [Tegillarca granosa]|uniref:EGF-like domain-containing protein n=1 Tax=Tegillarca granosa TaxID=220873 RepID=A0ABQ9EAY6_TEGGR|nr:hypothetical protein KUTeg_022571 [Tegillarca granosa]
MRETIHRMALWNFSFLGLAVLIGSVTCQAPNQERVGVVFSLGYYPNFLAVVEGQPTQLDGKTIAFDKYLKFNDSNTFAVSMVVDTQNESLYYFDSHLKSIFRINNFNLDLDVSRVTYDVIRDGISDSAVQIAFDWISRNIYWTDDYNDWIAVQPVFTRDRSLTKHVIDKMLQTPLALAIDPESGYLFFSDLKPAPRIEVCNLLGEKRRALVTSGLSYPSHIAVDHKEGRIFWVDSESGALESILYNGINRTLHAAGVAYFASSLHYFKGHICASFDYMYLVGCSPVNGFNEELFGFVKYAPITTTVYDPESQRTSITNRCNAKKCQHFCINTPTAARCVCKEGYQLNRDGVNCTAGHILSKKGILFTNGSNLCVLDIVAINSNKSRPNCVVNKLGYIHYLQADSNKGIVYHWNKNIRSIQKYNLVTGRLYNLTFTNDVKGLFYDWVNEELYWSESDQYGFRIRLFDLVTESESKYQYEEDTKSFEYLTGNPYNDILFWVLKENRYAYMIEMGTMKGSNRTIVMNSDSLTKPTALAYDSVYNRLYWIDSGEITSVKITTNIGQTKIIYHDYTGPTAHTLYLYKDYALWIYNNNIKAVVVEENDDYVYESTVLTVMNGSDVTCMTYFDQRTQTKTRAPCEGDNGGCQYLCIPTTNGPLCTCPFGYKVSKDGKSCRSDLLTNNFALIVDYDSKMYQIPLNKTITEDDIVAVNITEKRKGYISDIIYDATNGFVYWLIDGLELCRSKLNGENFTIITTIAEDYVENFEVDQTTGNIYIMPVLLYGHEVSGHISVLRQMASNEWKQTKIIEDLKDYFVIHPKKGYIFWLDSYQYMFGRTNMDGTNSMVLKKHTYEVWRFYIDYSGDRLYWSDDYYGGVYSMDTNGNDLKKFLAAPDGINAIAFQDNTVFIVMSHGSKIYRYDKTSGKEVKWMKNITYIQGIDYIAIVPGNKQPENDMCKNNNGDCSTFCLPTSSGRTCACEDGVKLRSDKKTCGNVCDSFLQMAK